MRLDYTFFRRLVSANEGIFPTKITRFTSEKEADKITGSWSIQNDGRSVGRSFPDSV